LVAIETSPPDERIRIPQPGTLEHLKYLSTLTIPEDSELNDPKLFLEHTMAVTSFSILARRHRTYWPLRNSGTVEFDSRMLGIGPEWQAIFRCQYGMNQHPAANNLSLIIHGQPKPQEQQPYNYEYGISIPIIKETSGIFYDPRRPSTATYTTRGSIRENIIYDEASYPEYKEDDPVVLFSAVQEAAYDMLRLMHYMYGER
jgi:hypothetical protein